MSKLPFSPRSILAVLVSVIILGLGFMACRSSAPSAPAGPPADPQATLSLPLSPTGMAATARPALPESRFLTLEFPPKIRAGDSEIVRLTLEVDDLGNITPTAELDGNGVTGEVIEIPDLYETHHVVAEARFDIAGMEIRPTELISAPLARGQTAVFYWSVRAGEVGVYHGTIWLHLRYVDKSNGEESRKTVSAQIVEIEAVNLLGLSTNLVRAVGLLGSVVGTVIGFPFFEDTFKLVLGRWKKRRKKQIYDEYHLKN